MPLNSSVEQLYNHLTDVYVTNGIRQNIIDNPISVDTDIQNSYLAEMDSLFISRSSSEWGDWETQLWVPNGTPQLALGQRLAAADLEVRSATSSALSQIPHLSK